MFTGLVSAVGTVRERHAAGDGRDARFVIDAPDAGTIPLGASIACSGCCLTAVAMDAAGFAVDVSAESLSRTILGDWGVGTRVNLERSLRVGDELGGHIVSGHVDGVGVVRSVTSDGGSWRLVFAPPRDLLRFIAEKGSVAVDGVSLTVNTADEEIFGVNIIPHTWTHTTLGGLREGARVNLEIDMLARYVARLREFG